MCRDNAEDSNSTINGAIKEESINVDSVYFDDIFKDISNTQNPNFQQVAKLCFKIAYEISDSELLEGIYNKIIDNRLESAIMKYLKTQKFEDLENFLEDLWACEILAYAKYEAGDKNSAVSVCKQALRLSQNSKKTWILLGKINKEEGRMEDAMDSFLNSLKAIPINFGLIPIYLDDF